MASAALTVPIDGNTKGLERALRDATGEIQGFGGRVRGTLRGIGGAFAAAFAGMQIAGLIGDSISDASDLEEASSKAAQIFGDGFMSELEGFAGDAATSLGLSEFQAIDAASTFGVFGKAAGLAGDDLGDFSTELTALAVDMASFNNTSPEEAILAIGAGLRGESEPLRRFGVLMDQATLEATALEEGIWDGTDAITAQEKSLAAAAVIMKQTTDQQGDFARTSGGLANQQKILRAQLANVSAEIGAKLLPVAVALATWFNDVGLPAIQRFGGWLEANIPPILQAVGDWFERHRDTIESVMQTIWTVVTTVWTQLRTAIGNALQFINGVWNVFAGIFRGDWGQFWEGIRGVFGAIWDNLRQLMSLGFAALQFIAAFGWELIKATFWDAVETVKETVKNGLDAILTFFGELPGRIVGAVGDLGSVLYNAGRAIIEGLINGIRSMFGPLEDALGWVTDRIPDWKGPAGTDRKLLFPAGRMIMEGLDDGLMDGFGRIVAPGLAGVTSGIGAMSATTGTGAGTAGAGGGAPIMVVVELDGRVLAKSMERVSERDGGLRVKLRAGG